MIEVVFSARHCCTTKGGLALCVIVKQTLLALPLFRSFLRIASLNHSKKLRVEMTSTNI
jgi:hypothetical protein